MVSNKELEMNDASVQVDEGPRAVKVKRDTCKWDKRLPKDDKDVVWYRTECGYSENGSEGYSPGGEHYKHCPFCKGVINVTLPILP